MIIWLKYQNPPAAAVALRIDALSYYDKDDVRYAAGESLRGIEYEHRMSKRLHWEVAIGADQLADTDTYAFLRAWWTAAARYFVADDAETEPIAGDFLAVRCDGGISPVQFLEGLVELPSWDLTLIEKRPRV